MIHFSTREIYDDSSEEDEFQDDCINFRVEKVTIVNFAIINKAPLDILIFLMENGGSVRGEDFIKMKSFDYNDSQIEEVKRLYYYDKTLKEPDCN